MVVVVIVVVVVVVVVVQLATSAGLEIVGRRETPVGRSLQSPSGRRRAGSRARRERSSPPTTPPQGRGPRGPKNVGNLPLRCRSNATFGVFTWHIRCMCFRRSHFLHTTALPPPFIGESTPRRITAAYLRRNQAQAWAKRPTLRDGSANTVSHVLWTN